MLGFIGWTPQLREKNLPLVIDNPRFLILPWIAILNLGSHILATVRRRLPEDWTERYSTTPVLIERPSSRPRATPARSIRPQDGHVSGPLRDEDATTPTRSTLNPRGTSGCGRCGKTGDEPSTGDAIRRHHPTTERLLRQGKPWRGG